MKPTLFDHIWIFLTVFGATYSQLVMKMRVSKLPRLERSFDGVVGMAIRVFSDPWILSAFGATFLAGVCWMIVLRKFDLSYAFPFTALNFLIMSWIGITIFNERWDMWKISGTGLVVIGILMIVGMNSKAD